ncbi:hypothetical protein, partial [uncultured Helicobacter sp.]|uniref:hypothetical protein n=1 Tax=uncultured Helicobacter sp. TaxID=175537 RepID=UPI00260BDEE4
SIDSKSRRNNMRLFQVVSKEKIVSKSLSLSSPSLLQIESKSVFGSVVGRIRILLFGLSLLALECRAIHHKSFD